MLKDIIHTTANLAANLIELAGSPIGDFLLAHDGGGDFVFNAVERGQAAGEAGENGRILAVSHE